MKEKDNRNTAVAYRGDALRKKMQGDEKNEKKIRTLTYHLLNSLKAGDTQHFADVLMRQYSSLNDPFPGFLIDIFRSEEMFLSLGYSFVDGLNGGMVPFTKDTKENEN